ncbi:hypothetical protein INR49_000856 [Caranx melampygus]|nr:hypothetical protein INR49_000856 [Caranx melampygus]
MKRLVLNGDAKGFSQVYQNEPASPGSGPRSVDFGPAPAPLAGRSPQQPPLSLLLPGPLHPQLVGLVPAVWTCLFLGFLGFLGFPGIHAAQKILEDSLWHRLQMLKGGTLQLAVHGSPPPPVPSSLHAAQAQLWHCQGGLHHRGPPVETPPHYPRQAETLGLLVH